MTSMFNLKKVDGTQIIDVDDANGLKVGAAGSALKEIRKYTATVDPANIAAAGTAEETFTVTGVQTGDVVLACVKPTHTANFGIVNCRVSAANTVAITFQAEAAVNAASETYTFVVARFA